MSDVNTIDKEINISNTNFSEETNHIDVQDVSISDKSQDFVAPEQSATNDSPSDDNTQSNTIFNPNELTFNDAPEPNCLALTVKKDYNLVIAKNVVLKTLKSTWKIVLSIFTLNFLKFFL